MPDQTPEPHTDGEAFADLAVKHARATLLIRRLWESRRKWQDGTDFYRRTANILNQAQFVANTQLAEARDWAAWFAAERDYWRTEAHLYHTVAAQNYENGGLSVALVARERDEALARIAELEAPAAEPDAYIAVKRLRSPNAAGPEWDWHATVIPAGDDFAEDRDWRLDRGFDLLPIVGTETGTRPAAAQPDPAGYVVVTRNPEGGVHRSATVWDSLDQARAAEGVQAGYADGTGCTAAVYALREVQQ